MMQELKKRKDMIPKKLFKRYGSSLPVTGAFGICCLLTLALSSCRNDEPVDMNAPTRAITITMSVPGNSPASGPSTYAMPTDQAKVNTVDVLCFKTPDSPDQDDVDKGTFLYRATVQHTAGAETFQVILAELDATPAVNQTLVILANCRTQVETQLATISVGDTKAGVISKLVLAHDQAFDASAMTGIPMWGEITDQPVRTGYSPGTLRVDLTRMLARINITNTEPDFVLTQAFLYNPRQKGSIIPDNWTAGDVTAPSNVSGAQMPRMTRFGAFAATNHPTVAGQQVIEDKIYTFEADNIAKANTNTLDATALVVGGRYNGSPTTSYYRVDLKDYPNNTFYDVKRNYSYNVTITKINEAGPADPDEAFEKGALIIASVEAWKEMSSSIQVIDPNGEYHLGIDVTRLNPDYLSEVIPIHITSDHPSGWEITDVPDWITLDRTTAAMNDAGQTTLTIAENLDAERSAKIKVSSSVMTATINVTQKDGRLELTYGTKYGSADCEIQYYTDRDATMRTPPGYVRRGDVVHTVPSFLSVDQGVSFTMLADVSLNRHCPKWLASINVTDHNTYSYTNNPCKYPDFASYLPSNLYDLLLDPSDSNRGLHFWTVTVQAGPAPRIRAAIWSPMITINQHEIGINYGDYNTGAVGYFWHCYNEIILTERQ